MVTRRQSWTQEKVNLLQKMVEQLEPTKKIASLINMSQRAVQSYIRDHESLDPNVPWMPLEENRGKKNKATKEARKDKIVSILDNDCTLTQKQMADELPAELKCSPRSIASILRELGVSRKKLRRVPIERNTPRTINLRKLYAQGVVRKPNSVLYFLDETGFNLHTGPRCGYAFRGLTPTTQQPGNRGPNRSVLACIGIRGLVKWEVKKGAYNGESLAAFLDELCPNLQSNAILIMDNAQCHHAEVVKTTLARHGIAYKFLHPYSPQLNPIEEFFSMLKSNQSKIRPRPRSETTLDESIEKSFEGLENYSMIGFYDHMRSFLPTAIDERQFL